MRHFTHGTVLVSDACLQQRVFPRNRHTPAAISGARVIKSKIMSYIKISDALRVNGAHSYLAKKAFHAQGKAFLKKLAAELCLAVNSYSVRSNMGGDGVTGEVVLHSDYFYLQLFNNCSVGTRILFRSCKGQKDYTGGRNQFENLSRIEDPGNQARFLNTLRDMVELEAVPA